MTFKNNNTVNYSETSRRKNLLHLVTSGRRRYEINDKSFMVERGTLVFIPDKTKYITTAFSQNDEDCAGIGICFDLDFSLFGNEPDVYYKNVSAQNDKVLELFQRIYENQKSNPLELLEHKYLFYKLRSCERCVTALFYAKFVVLFHIVSLYTRGVYCKGYCIARVSA